MRREVRSRRSSYHFAGRRQDCKRRYRRSGQHAAKDGQKRALVAAVLVVTNCSDAFTQDLEDGSDVQRNTPEEQKELAGKRVAEEKEKTANGTPKDLKILLDGIDK